jgi:multisubunit Na+/H+ antiporter MnhF subunit
VTDWWLLFAGVLLVAGLGPALYVGARGTTASRLLGLQFTGTVGALLLVALSVAVDQPSYLIVPLVLVLLSYAGTLVFTRLGAER